MTGPAIDSMSFLQVPNSWPKEGLAVNSRRPIVGGQEMVLLVYSSCIFSLCSSNYGRTL